MLARCRGPRTPAQCLASAGRLCPQLAFAAFWPSPGRRHMYRWFVCLAVGALLPAPAAADWFCLPPPPVRFEYRTITKYRTEYRTELKEVQRVVTRAVPE